jgi:hypothetical protein
MRTTHLAALGRPDRTTRTTHLAALLGVTLAAAGCAGTAESCALVGEHLQNCVGLSVEVTESCNPERAELLLSIPCVEQGRQRGAYSFYTPKNSGSEWWGAQSSASGSDPWASWEPSVTSEWSSYGGFSPVSSNDASNYLSEWLMDPKPLQSHIVNWDSIETGYRPDSEAIMDNNEGAIADWCSLGVPPLVIGVIALCLAI